jgi:iron complex transport system substrate-binding protein
MKFKSSRREASSARANFAKKRIPAARSWIALLIFVVPGAPVPAQTEITHAAYLPQGAAPHTRWLTDEMGRRVEVSTGVRRIVSLAPNLTEIVFALGEGDRLAGDTDFCDYPAEAMRKPHVGGPVNPNLEEVVALMPDLVLATKTINRRETVDGLARIRVPVYVTDDPRTVDAMIASIEHIGTVLHSEKNAAPLVEDLRARLSHLDQRIADAVPRRVFFVVWTEPLISIGRGTFIADALRLAGARSVVDARAQWPRINFEEIVKLQPEYLVFASAHAADTQHDIDELRTRPGWRDLNAMRDGKTIIISDSINRPAPRMVDAVEQLAHALHPDLFALAGSRRAPAYHSEEVCACAR